MQTSSAVPMACYPLSAHCLTTLFTCPITPQGNMSERCFNGQGADEDIVVASARAYVNALNKMIPYLTMR